MFVVYEGNHEFIICVKENEAELLKSYFIEGGRDLEDYNRKEITDNCFAVQSGLLRLDV